MNAPFTPVEEQLGRIEHYLELGAASLPSLRHVPQAECPEALEGEQFFERILYPFRAFVKGLGFRFHLHEQLIAERKVPLYHCALMKAWMALERRLSEEKVAAMVCNHFQWHKSGGGWRPDYIVPGKYWDRRRAAEEKVESLSFSQEVPLAVPVTMATANLPYEQRGEIQTGSIFGLGALDALLVFMGMSNEELTYWCERPQFPYFICPGDIAYFENAVALGWYKDAEGAKFSLMSEGSTTTCSRYTLFGFLP